MVYYGKNNLAGSYMQSANHAKANGKGSMDGNLLKTHVNCPTHIIRILAFYIGHTCIALVRAATYAKTSVVSPRRLTHCEKLNKVSGLIYL